MTSLELAASVVKRQETSLIDDLVKRFHGAVHRRARRILRNEEDAADVAQEVFLRATRARGGSLQTHPRAWLYRVTTNLCLNRLRDSKRRDELLSEATDRSNHEHAGLHGAATTLQSLLRDVPADLLSPAVYYYVEELSHAEIAARMRVSRRTVGNRIVAFHAFLRGLEPHLDISAARRALSARRTP